VSRLFADRRRVLRLAALAFLVAWPWFGLPTSLLGNANTAGVYFLGGVSVVMLTGWVGQVSLAQASFVGIAAYVTAMATRGLDLPFPFNLFVGMLGAGVAAALLGLVALRVRGLYLAVATLIFAWVTDAYLFSASWMGGTGGSTSAPVRRIGTEGGFPYVDFGNRRTFYYLVLATCAMAVFALVNVRDSKVGRAFFAVRGSEIAAASFGVDVIATKLIAFAGAGMVAGLAGGLLMVHQGSAVADQFNLTASLFYLSIAVVGGLASIGGAVAASLVFAALNELFYRVEALAGYLDVVSALLLAAVLLAYPGGLAAFGRTLQLHWRRSWPGIEAEIRRRGTDLWQRVPEDVRRRAEELVRRRRRPPAPVPTAPEVVAGPIAALSGSPNGTRRRRRAGSRTDAPVVLEAHGVTVEFGGLLAVDDVSLQVREGEIVGLIGPNGAGKTTLFNAISGLNQPTAGTVAIRGEDAGAKRVHERARLGLARTFQVIQLFPQLDVFDNVLVGTHLQSNDNVLSRLVLTKGAIEAELEAVARVREVVTMLGLWDIRHHTVAGLPFGTLRMVELARALATGAKLVMLDEPASGLDNRETDRLSGILRAIRSDFGVSLLVIEHDVRMVTALTDYMYVIDRGRLIAEGTPAQIQTNETVIAAYLGTSAAAPVEVMA
jgi:branched-chain amino acid transport system permease protein